MAQMIFTRVGQVLGGRFGAMLGAGLGAAADRTLVNSLSPTNQIGPRLSAVRISQGSQNEPIIQVFGRARIAPTLLWVSRFKEHRKTTRAHKNSPKTEQFSYSLSFALGLCDGPIEAIGRFWVDGRLHDLAPFNYRLYGGDETQMPDSLIVAIEGEAPAYRGTAYMVFEDFDLTAFGNRLPNFSVEVFRRPKGRFEDLESKITSVCMIPGAGEYVYATTEIAALKGLTKATSITRNSGLGKNDFSVALDQLQAQLPHVKAVNLVVSWFGTDLRATHCTIKPGVERRDTLTTSMPWQVCGLDRASAHLVSTLDEARPAYGGTPSDQSVIEAITELKSRGFAVTLIPFILMDIAEDNALADPYGAQAQGAYPWRGRITCDVAPSLPGTADKTLKIEEDIASFVGAAVAADFSISDSGVHYTGGPDFGFARFVLHMAALGVAAGGVEAILLGSELRGLTTLRSSAGYYPFVQALKFLAAQVRALVGPETKLSYGADWSEYHGHRPDDGSHDLYFHLDPLWADSQIDFVGLDWYAPVTDWREGDTHLDAREGYFGPYDQTYLLDRINGGEGFDWYYACEADRNGQIRTPILDSAYGEDWVFRPKDLKSWWQKVHYDRPLGVRNEAPTQWVAQSKPVRFIEYGCAAIDKGANAPNRFLDPKSSESALPYYSSGARDDKAQAAYLKAFHDFYAVHNPVSPIYGAGMVERMSVWCWDARPYPYFPSRSDLWGDCKNWHTGHWLNGRVGSGDIRNLVTEITSQTKINPDDVQLNGLEGQVDSFIIDRPMSAQEALRPVLAYLGAEMAEISGRLSFFNTDVTETIAIKTAQLADYGSAPIWEKRELREIPAVIALRCYDLDRDYQLMGLQVRDSALEGNASQAIDLPLGLYQNQAYDFAYTALERAGTQREILKIAIDPLLALQMEVGDRVRLDEGAAIWRIQSLEHHETPSISLMAAGPAKPPVLGMPKNNHGEGGGQTSWITQFMMIDQPPLFAEGDVFAPILVASAAPFQAMDIHGGAIFSSLRKKGQITAPSGIGYVLEASLARFGQVRQLMATLDIYLEGLALSAKTWDEVWMGDNYLMVQSLNSDWEVIQFQQATLLADNTYRLKGLVRGQWGSEAACTAGFASGAMVVVIEGEAVRADIGLETLGLDWLWRAGGHGFGGAALNAKDIDFRWTGKSLLPRAPRHGRILGQYGQDMRLRFTPVSRCSGDSFETEPPFYEEAELFRLRFYQGDSLVRETEVSQTMYDYGTALQYNDYPAGFNGGSKVAIAQKSNIVGFGRELVVGLG